MSEEHIWFEPTYIDTIWIALNVCIKKNKKNRDIVYEYP